MVTDQLGAKYSDFGSFWKEHGETLNQLNIVMQIKDSANKNLVQSLYETAKAQIACIPSEHDNARRILSINLSGMLKGKVSIGEYQQCAEHLWNEIKEFIKAENEFKDFLEALWDSGYVDKSLNKRKLEPKYDNADEHNDIYECSVLFEYIDSDFFYNVRHFVNGTKVIYRVEPGEQDNTLLVKFWYHIDCSVSIPRI